MAVIYSYIFTIYRHFVWSHGVFGSFRTCVQMCARFFFVLLICVATFKNNLQGYFYILVNAVQIKDIPWLLIFVNPFGAYSHHLF